MRNLIVTSCVLALGLTARAEILVTEIWAGGLPGDEVTADWFELTNFGENSVSTDGWYYDDESGDPTVNDPVNGLTDIAPGESVILVTSWEDDWATSDDAINAFLGAWDDGSGILDGVQIGWVSDGSGLGGGGDAVYIFDGNTPDALTIATQSYPGPTEPESYVSRPDGTWNDDYAQVGVWGAYESFLPASSDPEIGAAVGSPGLVPEPASLMLLLASAGLIARRR